MMTSQTTEQLRQVSNAILDTNITVHMPALFLAWLQFCYWLPSQARSCLGDADLSTARAEPV